MIITTSFAKNANLSHVVTAYFDHSANLFYQLLGTTFPLPRGNKA